MKKILVIHTNYRQKGGEDIAVSNEIKLLKNNYDVHELYFSNQVDSFLKQAIAFFFITNKESNKLLKKSIKEFKPDYAYVHNTWFKASLGIFKILDKHKIKTILKIHNFRYDCTKSFLAKNHLQGKTSCSACGMEYVSSRIYNKYFIDSYLKSIFVNFYGVRYFRILKKNRIKILVLTNYHKEYLGRLINQVNKVSVFHNYLETQEEPNLKRESRYIVYAGRISKEKGVDELISSFLKASLSDVKLKIIGIGPDLERLEDKYIKNNIEFVGEIGNNAVLEIIRNAVAVVTATKLLEGQPTLLCEASSLGVVSIFPKTGGINDFFPEDYPYSFNQFDYDDLTKKISSLSNQKQINIFSKKNKDYIQKLLERNYLLKKFQEIIDE